MERIYARNVFGREICGLCGICGKNLTAPLFCLTQYAGDKQRFFRILKHVMGIRQTNSKKFKNLYLFEAFCGLFCYGCPLRSMVCETSLEKVINCYTAFSEQFEGQVDAEVKSDIFEVYSGVELDDIGVDYRPSPSKQLRGMAKSKKKRIKRLISSAKRALTVAKIVLEPPKPASTTIFYNDDESWKAKITEILGEDISVSTGEESENKADNRQPTDPVELTRGV